MRLKLILPALAALGLAATVQQTAMAATKEKPGTEAEAKITAALKAAYPYLVIIDMGKETEDGLSFVSVTLTSKGNKMDADVTEDGTIVGTEEAADISAFPKPAAKALKTATKDMTVKSIEIAKTYAEADKNDKSGTKVVKLAHPTVAYEADVEKDGQKGEYSVSADGTILESPKWVKSGSKEEKD
jgi:hypothetical protein